MATIIHGRTGRDVYVDVLSKIRLFGRSRPSRNGPTRDLGHVTIVLDEPFDALPVGVGRNVSERVAAAEAIQLIGAFSDPEWLIERAPQMHPYREPDGRFWGAYGARIGVQISGVVRKLRADPWTRQAVATLWHDERDGHVAYAGKLDYPCTVALGFIMQIQFTGASQLDMNVIMRSNDAWLGLPYDMFQFTQLQWTVARMLGVAVGRYYHTAWSLHLYERDLEASHAVVAPSEPTVFDPSGIGVPNLEVADVIYRARTIARDPSAIEWELTPSERWYRDVLHKA